MCYKQINNNVLLKFLRIIIMYLLIKVGKNMPIDVNEQIAIMLPADSGMVYRNILNLLLLKTRWVNR